jgi:hypothetical protein
MGSFKIILLAVIMCIGIATDANARVQKLSKNNNNKFETLPKIQESSENKKRTLLDENLMKVPGEDDEDAEGSGDTKHIKDPSEWADEYDDDYLDEEDYEEDDDEDIYEDEDENYSGDDIYDDDEEYDDDDDYEDDYDDEEYISEKDKKKKIKDMKKNDKSSKLKPVLNTSDDEDLHFADDEDTHKDLNLSDDEERKKTSEIDDEILYEYYNEINFKEDEEDYEEEDLHSPNEDVPQQTFSTERSGPSKKETVSSGNLPTYLTNLTTSHFLLMAASALISFILFTIAFIVCCHQRRQSAFQKKKFGNMPFVIDSNFLAKSSQKSHHPSHFVNNSSTSIVKNYQRVPTSTKEFLSDSTSTSCSGLENPHHQPHFMEGGTGETKRPLLP